MPSDEMQDISPPKVTPEAGKGALGARWSWKSTQPPDSEPARLLCGRDEFVGKPAMAEVDVSQHLSFAAGGKAREGKAEVANRTR